MGILKKINPKRLYVSCDGAKNEEDAFFVQQTREVILKNRPLSGIQRKFEAENHGCGIAVQRACDWFFTHNDHGIILEDNIIPQLGFFDFMRKMLLKYKDNKTVASVSGFCPWPDFLFTKNIPLRSKYFSMWGWGTWAEKWNNYCQKPDTFMERQWRMAIQKTCESDNEREFWNSILTKIVKNKIDTWDYQFLFLSWSRGQHHIRPSKSLIQNIGFGVGATHTTVEPAFIKSQNLKLMGDKAHPFLDSTYFYFRHLTFLDNGHYAKELVSNELANVQMENQALKRKINFLKKRRWIKYFFKK